MKPTPQDLESAQMITLRYGTGGVRANGKMIAFSGEPMVCVQLQNGETIWWNESLCDRAGRSFVNGTVLIHTENGERRFRIDGRWVCESGFAGNEDEYYAHRLNDVTGWRVLLGGLES